MNYRGTKVLVTGADGFIGSHLVEALDRRGAEITALSLYNSFDFYGWLDDLTPDALARIRCVRGDVCDAAFVRRLLAGQHVVFHLAALIAIPHSYLAAQSYVATNIVGTLNVLEAAREAGVQRVVHTSTSEVYGTAQSVPIDELHPLHGQSPYAASKIGADMMAEAFARSFDLGVVILRPFNTFGPRQSERAVIPSLIRQFLDPQCEAIRVGDTSTIRDFSYVEDTASAFLAVGAHPTIRFGVPYNAGSGTAVRISELIGLLRTTTGIEKPLFQQQERLRPANSEVRALQADASRIQTEVGWQPKTTLRDGLARTVAWWRERLDAGRVRRKSAVMT